MEGLWIAIGAAVTAVTTGIGVLAGKWHEARKIQRADAINEWKGIADKQDDIIDDLRRRVDILGQKMRETEAAEAKCQLQLAVMQAEVAHLREDISRLQIVPLKVVAPCYVTATMPEGLIESVSEDVYHLLGWRPTELLGKNIEMIIPQEFRERHDAGVKRVAESKELRPGTIAVAAFALHKMGSRVPVIVTLSEVSKEPWRVAAQINYRTVTI